MELQTPLPDLLSTLAVSCESAADFTAYLPPDWREAHDLIEARFERQDPALENTRRRLNILSEFMIHLPPIETTETLINAAMNNNQSMLERLEATRLAMRLLEWQTTILALSSKTQDSDHLPLNERPLEANFFVSSSPRLFQSSIITPQLLNHLVVEKSEEHWCYQGCPDLNTSNAVWFQYFGQEQRLQIFEGAVRYLESLPDHMTALGLNIIGRAIYAAIEDIRFETLPTDLRNARMIADLLRFKANMIDAFEVLVRSAESLNPGLTDIIDLAQADEIEMAILSLRAERVASDLIRRSVIPNLALKNAPCSEAYWAIHLARFSEAPASVQNFGDSPFMLHDYTESAAEGDFYSRNIGKLRDVNVVCKGSFEHLPHRHLPMLSERFFNALEAGLENPLQPREQLLERLCLTQAFLTLSHLPFDGAGRTNEDFIVYYAKRMGVDFSLSGSGYRHHLSPLACQFQKIETQFKYEFDLNTLLKLGIVPGKFDEDGWIQKVDYLLENIHASGINGFNVEKSLGSIDFIAALEGDQAARTRIIESFPSLVDMYELFSRALEENYTFAAPQSAADLDRGIARSLVTAPWRFRQELICEWDRFYGTVLGNAFLKEHLHTRSSRFVSEKLRAQFDEMREQLFKES